MVKRTDSISLDCTLQNHTQVPKWALSLAPQLLTEHYVLLSLVPNNISEEVNDRPWVGEGEHKAATNVP